MSSIALGRDPSGDEIVESASAPSMPGSDRPLLSVVVPCRDEGLVISSFHRALCAVAAELELFSFEFVYVDDGSVDDTRAQLDQLTLGDPRIRLCELERSCGQQVALNTGIDAAHGDLVALMDADLQHPPDLLPTLIADWRRGFEVVSTRRLHNRGSSRVSSAASKLFYLGLNVISARRVEPGASDFCLLTRRAVGALQAEPERRRFLRGAIAGVKLSRCYVEYVAPPRYAGVSSYTLGSRLRLAFDAWRAVVRQNRCHDPRRASRWAVTCATLLAMISTFAALRQLGMAFDAASLATLCGAPLAIFALLVRGGAPGDGRPKFSRKLSRGQEAREGESRYRRAGALPRAARSSF
jgi:hypothetical protein